MKRKIVFMFFVLCLMFSITSCKKKKVDFSFSEYGITLENKTVDFDGNSHSIEITGTLPSGITVSYTGNGQVNPGTYTVTASFGDSTGKYNPIPELTATLTINQKKNALEGISFSNKTVTYDGNSHSIEITGTLPSGVEVSYTGNNQVNAGEYSVVATFTDTTGLYQPITPLTATLTIKKATYDMSGIIMNNNKLTYDGDTHSLFIEGQLPEGVSVSYENNGMTNVGTYTVVANFVHNNPNYNNITPRTAVLVIEKAVIDVNNIKFEDKTFEYDGNTHSIEIEGVLPEGVTVTYTGNEAKDEGTYLVEAEFTHSSGNYHEGSLFAYITIVPKTTYTIVYELNGGIGKQSEVVKVNEDVTLPIPTREGYKFLGWLRTPDSDFYCFSYSQDHNQDVTFYAAWEALKNTYVIENNDARVINLINPSIFIDDDFTSGKYNLYNTNLKDEYEIELGVNAFNSLTDALSSLKEGDVIYIASGSYDSAVSLNVKNITLVGPNYNLSSAHESRFDEAKFTSDITVSSDDVEINGIEIANTAVIKFIGTLSNDSLKSIYVSRKANENPLYFFYSADSTTLNNVTIDNCRFYTTSNSSGHKAISLNGLVNNCKVTNNYFEYGTGAVKLTDMIYLKNVSGNVDIIGNNLAMCVSDNLIINIATIKENTNIKINNNIVKGFSTSVYTGPIVVGTTAIESGVTVEVIGNELYYQDAYILKVGGAVDSLVYKYNIVVGADDLFRLDSLTNVTYDSNYSDAGSSMTVRHWKNTSTTIGTLTDTNSFASIDALKAAYLGEKYTITYDKDVAGKGTGTAYKNQVVSLPKLYVSGYEFLGWATDKESTDYIYDYSQDTLDDVTLYAIFVKIATYNVTFVLDGGTLEGDSAGSIVKEIDKFSSILVPIKTGYVFLGWYDDAGKKYTKAADFTKDVTVTAKWSSDDTIDASFESTSWVVTGEQITVNAYIINNPTKEVVWKSLTPNIATVEDGVITGVKEGVATIVASSPDSDLYDYEIYVTVFDEEPDGILGLIVESNNATLYSTKDLVIGSKSSADEGGMWGYYTDILGSVSRLFYGKDFTINNTWLLTEDKTDKSYGVMDKIEFITFHYAADTPTSQYGGGSQIASLSSDLTVLYDSNNEAYWQNEVSYHFGVGNDGVYSSLPENYAGWHAGTGDRITTWYPSGVMVEPGDPELAKTTLEADGYFYINGRKTNYENTVQPGAKLTEMGFAYKVVDGQYYMPDFWYSSTYQRVCSKGGNMNSIGIESSVRQNLDLWLTWQYSAQLCAHLLLKYDLPLSQLVGHCFWTGKWCPQPMLENDLEIWNEFVQMVKREMIRMASYSDYKLTLSTTSNYLQTDGRIKSQPETSKCITYDVTYNNGTTSKTVTLSTIIPGSSK